MIVLKQIYHSYQIFNLKFMLTVFIVTIVLMLVIDLGVFNKNAHSVSNKEALIWSGVWISLSMAFSALIYYTQGLEKFSQFQAAYWIEKSLSVDNLFVFILVFNYFNVTSEKMHRVLFWGVLGAIILRAIFIFTGVWLIEATYFPEFMLFGKLVKISPILLFFGVFLVYAGIKSWGADTDDDDEKDFSKSPGSKFIHKLFTVSKEYDGSKFFTRVQTSVGLIKMATPLLVVVAVIEFTDVLFAVDSIPAIFAISSDPFILYTSNIFAILGLRSLFFLLNNFINYFSKLKYGLAIILTFIGAKMVIAPVMHIDSTISLLIVLCVLVGSTIWSVLTKDAATA